jgi:hypothetical protein
MSDYVGAQTPTLAAGFRQEEVLPTPTPTVPEPAATQKSVLEIQPATVDTDVAVDPVVSKIEKVEALLDEIIDSEGVTDELMVKIVAKLQRFSVKQEPKLAPKQPAVVYYSVIERPGQLRRIMPLKDARPYIVTPWSASSYHRDLYRR